MTATPAPTDASPARAALWMIGAVVSFSTMAVAGRAVSLELDTFEIMLFRSLIGVVLVLAVAGAAGAPIRLARLPLHTARNLAHFAGQNLWFFAVATAPLAQVFAIEFTTPIWALLLAPLILGEAITRRGALAAVVGFAGILLVAQPGRMELSPGLLAAAGAAVGFGLTALFTRRLTRSENVASILLLLTLMQSVFGLLCAGADLDIALPSAAALPWVALIAVCGLVAHLCLTTALSLAPAAQVMPIDFARLPLIALVGLALYGEVPGPSVILGGALIVGANWVNLRRARPVAIP